MDEHSCGGRRFAPSLVPIIVPPAMSLLRCCCGSTMRCYRGTGDPASISPCSAMASRNERAGLPASPRRAQMSAGRMGDGIPGQDRRCLARQRVEYDGSGTVRPGHGEPETHCWLVKARRTSSRRSRDRSIDRGKAIMALIINEDLDGHRWILPLNHPHPTLSAKLYLLLPSLKRLSDDACGCGSPRNRLVWCTACLPVMSKQITNAAL